MPRKRDLEFEKSVKQAAIDLKLQPEDNFILKVVQLEELFAVRHSVFIVGDAGKFYFKNKFFFFCLTFFHI